MPELLSISTVIISLARRVPDLIAGLALEQGKARFSRFLDEKKYARQMQLAVKNAVERSILRFSDLGERDQYLGILKLLSEDQYAPLCKEAVQLFTLNEEPDLNDLSERYDLSQPPSILHPDRPYENIDAMSYLGTFFEALRDALFTTHLFHEQLRDAL